VYYKTMDFFKSTPYTPGLYVALATVPPTITSFPPPLRYKYVTHFFYFSSFFLFCFFSFYFFLFLLFVSLLCIFVIFPFIFFTGFYFHPFVFYFIFSLFLFLPFSFMNFSFVFSNYFLLSCYFSFILSLLLKRMKVRQFHRFTSRDFTPHLRSNPAHAFTHAPLRSNPVPPSLATRA
jgi:hypothetical protein